MADLKRYILHRELNIGITVIIDGVQYNHLNNVIRQKKGDRVILLNGDGFDYTAEITDITKREAMLLVVSKEENNRKTRLRLTVFCGLLKGEANENQAVKLSELGVYGYAGFTSENCVIKSEGKKYERLQRIADESSKQCKRALPVKVFEFTDFYTVLENIKDYDIKIIAYENEETTTLKEALNGVSQKNSVALIIGPEGGFTENEVALAVNAGCKAVTLGKTILKADTAAICAAAAILYEAGEWSR